MGLHKGELKEIMIACIILHNMIVDYQRVNGFEADSIQCIREETLTYRPLSDSDDLPSAIVERWLKIMERPVHVQLQEDLAIHQWNLKGKGPSSE